MEIFLLASVLELNPLDHVQLRGSRLGTATEGRSHMLKSYGRVQSRRAETRLEDEARTLPGGQIYLKKAEVLLPVWSFLLHLLVTLLTRGCACS